MLQIEAVAGGIEECLGAVVRLNDLAKIVGGVLALGYL